MPGTGVSCADRPSIFISFIEYHGLGGVGNHVDAGRSPLLTTLRSEVAGSRSSVKKARSCFGRWAVGQCAPGSPPALMGAACQLMPSFLHPSRSSCSGARAMCRLSIPGQPMPHDPDLWCKSIFLQPRSQPPSLLSHLQTRHWHT